MKSFSTYSGTVWQNGREKVSAFGPDPADIEKEVLLYARRFREYGEVEIRWSRDMQRWITAKAEEGSGPPHWYVPPIPDSTR